MGQAYGFFQYNGRKEDVLIELPPAIGLSHMPSGMNISLESLEEINASGDPVLEDVVEAFKEIKMNYVLNATLQDAENKKTASLVLNVLNSLYASRLYAQGEPFSAEVVYREGDKFITFA
jgi:hypothetical protein